MFGWLSLGIAAAEIFAPKMLARTMGVRNHNTLMRLLGLRELAAGAGILSQTRKTPMLTGGMWSRVAGDAMDLALLAAAAKSTRRPGGLAMITAIVVGATVADAIYAKKLQDEKPVTMKMVRKLAHV